MTCARIPDSGTLPGSGGCIPRNGRPGAACGTFPARPRIYVPFGRCRSPSRCRENSTQHPRMSERCRLRKTPLPVFRHTSCGPCAASSGGRPCMSFPLLREGSGRSAYTGPHRARPLSFWRSGFVPNGVSFPDRSRRTAIPRPSRLHISPVRTSGAFPHIPRRSCVLEQEVATRNEGRFRHDGDPRPCGDSTACGRHGPFQDHGGPGLRREA